MKLIDTWGIDALADERDEEQEQFNLIPSSFAQVVFAVFVAGILWFFACAVLPFGDYIGGRP